MKICILFLCEVGSNNDVEFHGRLIPWNEVRIYNLNILFHLKRFIFNRSAFLFLSWEFAKYTPTAYQMLSFSHYQGL